MTVFVKYSKIRGFSDAIIHARKHAGTCGGEVDFEGTVKIHGTNAGVRIGQDTYQPQSRTRSLDMNNDNYGFAAWALGNDVRSAMLGVASAIRDANALSERAHVVVYGEWAGPGIQSGVAVNRLKERQFIIFGAGIPTPGDDENQREYLDLSGCDISRPEVSIRSVWEAPLYRLSVDMLDGGSCEKAAHYANEITEAVDKLCPWGLLHGIEGHGEGVVWKPVGRLSKESGLYFKTKGDGHRKGGKKIAKTHPERLASVFKFADYACTHDRMVQGVGAVVGSGNTIDMTITGHFMRWIKSDIQTECKNELDESGLKWADVQREVSSRALAFWKSEVARSGDVTVAE